MGVDDDNSCAVCGNVASQRCARCFTTSYCSKEHQKTHWQTHKTTCCPYRIEENSLLGRYLVAARDLNPGDIIMKDPPLVLGPRQVTAPVCLGCFSAAEDSYSCTLCGWPVCNTNCEQNPLHLPECQISRRRSPKLKITKFHQVNQMYECIMPLRCLWLRDNEPKKWKTLSSLESHINKRKGTDVYSVIQTNVAEFARIYLKATEFSEEEFQNVCGIIDVNGFEIPGPSMVGLYGKACLLEHTCVPNSARTFDEQMNIIIRASVPIKKGDHITTCYTDPMWGMANRQAQLLISKHFICRCPRCSDPTEMGTHLSSLKCSFCNGLVIPPSLESTDNLWLCNSCPASIPDDVVNIKLKQLGEKLISLRGGLCASENFLKETSKCLSENHYYRSDVKLALAQMYGRQGLQLTASPDSLIQRKIQLCRDVLELANTFSPGIARLRGILQHELHAALMEQYQRLSKKHKLIQGKNLLMEAESLLKESIQILSLESPTQDEYQVAMQAKEHLPHLTQLLAKCR